MSLNRYRPHIFIVPEDDANRQIANGFLTSPALRARTVQVLPNAGGWTAVRDRFEACLNDELSRYPEGFFILLVDFDDNADRKEQVLSKVSPQHRDRVFVLGAGGEPEALRKDLGSFERIGKALARDCVEETDAIWGHPLLRHNAAERARMMPRLRSILYEAGPGGETPVRP